MQPALLRNLELLPLDRQHHLVLFHFVGPAADLDHLVLDEALLPLGHVELLLKICNLGDILLLLGDEGVAPAALHLPRAIRMWPGAADPAILAHSICTMLRQRGDARVALPADLRARRIKEWLGD